MVLSDKNDSFFFFLVVNYLWTDCDRTNKLADYSRRFYILKHYFKLRPLAKYSLAIHINYSHCNWHFLSVLLKHHLMRLCEFFIVDCFYESIFTVIYCAWIFTCMSNCETPTFVNALVNAFFCCWSHEKGLQIAARDWKYVILVTDGVQGFLGYFGGRQVWYCSHHPL